MPRVLLFTATTGYQIRVFDDSARRLGIELVLATDRCHVLADPWGDRAIPVRFEDPQASALRVVEARPIHGIVAVGDRPAVLAAHAARALGIPYNSPESVEACHNKYKAREVYRAAGLPVPMFFRVAITADPNETARRARYPCVLKPLGLSASRGVIRANSPPEYIAAFERIAALLESTDVLQMREEQNRYIQVEDYIEGREFALEGLLQEGRLKVLAIFDKPDPLEGPFFEETVYVTPSRASAEVQSTLIQMAQRGIQALGLTSGPIHAELRHNQCGAWILEIAARPIGGLCARALQFGQGIPLEELILRHALGEDVSAIERAEAASGVMMIPIARAGIYEGVTGIERARTVPGIEEVIITAKEGQLLRPLPEGASYLGFLFAVGTSPDEVETALRQAHQELQFQMATTLTTFRPSMLRSQFSTRLRRTTKDEN